MKLPKMIKVFFLSFLFLNYLFNDSYAQNALNFGPTLNSGTKSFPLNGRFGFGGSVEYTRGILKSGHIRGYLAYDRFPHKLTNSDSRIVQDSMLVMGMDGYHLS